MERQKNLLTTSEEVRELLQNTRTIAVLGIKPESHAGQPAYYVAKYMADRGYDVIPVPVYYPEVTEILGRKVYRSLNDVPGQIDLLNVFRRSEDIPKHTDEILSKKPKAVWFQLGIRNDEVAAKLAEAGIKVVQNLCLMVEHRELV
ncbi:MAG: CoA-binding protein [Pyrinomonadaceae bacterium]